MKNEREYSLSKLDDAFSKLKEGINSVRDELGKDGVIQRFEFTVELLWKTLKIFLRDKGIEARTPKDSLKEAFKIGWITDENVYLNMLTDRNMSSHIYDRSTSEEIYLRIKDDYIKAIEEVLEELRNK